MKNFAIAFCLMVFLLFFSFDSMAVGLLPSLTDTIGKPMPSLGKALGRYPDAETESADGGNIEVFYNITETDFNTFSVYLSEQGATLEDYKTTGNSFSASIQVEGNTITFTYDTQTREARVTYPKGTYDEWLNYAKTQFGSVIQLLDEGKKEAAVSVLFTIPNYSRYSPASKYLETHSELATTVAVREAKLASFRNVGGYVTFGSYEQDNNKGNGQEPIEWLVLYYNAAHNHVLLLSRYGLDAKPYNTEQVDITWEKCTLRAWLNGEFINNAFSTAEQAAILTTAVDNSKTQSHKKWWSTNSGSNTQDKVFLLSYAQASKFLGVTYDNSSNMKSIIVPTAYAIKQGAYASKRAEGKASGWWWLRSPGSYQNNAAVVNIGGSLVSSNVSEHDGCIRPALWINLESDIF